MDGICSKISHLPFQEPDPLEPKPSHRLSLRQFRETVPCGWIVRETIDGQYLFIRPTDQNATTWTHRSPEIDPELYAECANDPLDDCKPSTKHSPIPMAGALRSIASTCMSLSLELPKLHVRIHSNLESALRHLRYADRGRTLGSTLSASTRPTWWRMTPRSSACGRLSIARLRWWHGLVGGGEFSVDSMVCRGVYFDGL